MAWPASSCLSTDDWPLAAGTRWSHSAAGRRLSRIADRGDRGRRDRNSGRAILRVKVDNHAHTIELTAIPAAPRTEKATINKGTSAKETTPARSASWDETLTLAANAPGMAEIVFGHNGRVLGRANGPEAQLKINPRAGNRTGDAASVGTSRRRIVGRSAVATDRVSDSSQRAAAGLAVAARRDAAAGNATSPGRGQGDPIHETLKPTWLADAGTKPGQAFELDGVFDVAATDTYQFQLWHDGDVKLAVDGRTLYEGKEVAGNGAEQSSDRERFAPRLRYRRGLSPTESCRTDRAGHAAADLVRRARNVLSRRSAVSSHQPLTRRIV